MIWFEFMHEELTIKVGQRVHKVKGAPITVLVPGPDIFEKITVPEAFRLDSEAAMYHMERVQKFHPETEAYVRKVFSDLHILNEAELGFTPESLRTSGNGVKFVAGRIDLTLKLNDKGIGLIHHQYPETGLHPGVHGNFVEVLIALSERYNKMVEMRSQAQLLTALEEIEEQEGPPKPPKDAKPLFPE
jgi:hypothetical protein